MAAGEPFGKRNALAAEESALRIAGRLVAPARGEIEDVDRRGALLFDKGLGRANGVGQVRGGAQTQCFSTPARRVEAHLPGIEQVLLDQHVLTVRKLEAVSTTGRRAPRQVCVRLHVIRRFEAKKIDALGDEIQVLRRLDLLDVHPRIALGNGAQSVRHHQRNCFLEGRAPG